MPTNTKDEENPTSLQILGFSAPEMIYLSFMSGVCVGWISGAPVIPTVPAIVMVFVPTTLIFIKSVRNMYKEIQKRSANIKKPEIQDQYVLLEENRDKLIDIKPAKSKRAEILTAYSNHGRKHEEPRTVIKGEQNTIGRSKSIKVRKG